MYQEKQRRAAIWRHFLALTFTIAFHGILLTFIVADGDWSGLQDYLPETVQEWLDPDTAATATTDDDTPRP
jgi:hypothetical protein